MTQYLAFLLCGLALFSPPIQAHLLKVFAAAEGNRIDGSVYYSGGAKAAGAKVVVRSPEGRVLVDLSTDDEGRFAFEATEQVDHLIVAETREGHLAKWTVAGAELAGDAPTPVGILSPSASKPPDAVAVDSAPGGTGKSPSLEALVSRSVAQQIRPLREQIVANEERVRLRDLLGGIGYIVGVAGALLWWRSRGERKKA